MLDRRQSLQRLTQSVRFTNLVDTDARFTGRPAYRGMSMNPLVFWLQKRLSLVVSPWVLFRTSSGLAPHQLKHPPLSQPCSWRFQVAEAEFGFVPTSLG